MSNILKPWNPEENKAQAQLAIGTLLGESALTLLGVTFAAATGNTDLIPAVVVGGALAVVATGAVAGFAPRG